MAYNCGPALEYMHLLRTLCAATLLVFPGMGLAADFATGIHPILAGRCAPCHSGMTPAAGLSLASRAALLSGGAGGPAIVPGNSGASLLIQKVSGQRGSLMPASGEPLTASQIATLRAWIDEGAVWPEYTPT